jgi:hypothetical protein
LTLPAYLMPFARLVCVGRVDSGRRCYNSRLWGRNVMRDETIPDWQSRVRVARYEARDFGHILVAAYVGTATISAGVVAAAHWLLHFSTPVLLLIGVCAIIISVGAVVGEAAHRHYIQCAFVEMTLSHLEGEIERLHVRLDGIAHDADLAASEFRRTRRSPDPL